MWVASSIVRFKQLFQASLKQRHQQTWCVCAHPHTAHTLVTLISHLVAIGRVANRDWIGIWPYHRATKLWYVSTLTRYSHATHKPLTRRSHFGDIGFSFGHKGVNWQQASELASHLIYPLLLIREQPNLVCFNHLPFGCDHENKVVGTPCRQTIKAVMRKKFMQDTGRDIWAETEKRECWKIETEKRKCWKVEIEKLKRWKVEVEKMKRWKVEVEKWKCWKDRRNDKIHSKLAEFVESGRQFFLYVTMTATSWTRTC